jgi:hypothetical protein
MKNRKREICTSGTVRDEDGNVLIYSANDRGDRGNVGIIRSPIRASILPDRSRNWDGCENTDDRQIVGSTTNGRAAIARPSTSTMTDATTSAVAIAAIGAE